MEWSSGVNMVVMGRNGCGLLLTTLTSNWELIQLQIVEIPIKYSPVMIEFNNIRIIYFYIFLLLISGGIQEEKERNIDFPGAGEVPVYNVNRDDTKEISFDKEVTFGEGDSVLFGRPSGFAVDSLNQVYIGDPERKTIHVFDGKGVYLLNIGREGRGPGEFIVSPNPAVANNTIYLYDPMQFRITAYSPESFKTLYTKNVNPKNLFSIDSLKAYRMGTIKFRNDGKYLVRFNQVINPDPNHKSYNLDKRDVRYYLMDQNRKLIPSQIHKKKEPQFIPFPPQCKRFEGGIMNGVANLSFLPKELVAFSDEGYIYSAWSDDFLIKIKDPSGKFVSSIYSPFEKVELERKDALASESYDARRCVVNHMDLPQSWPVINEIKPDDEGRIWVSTIIDDREYYEWWVLNRTGNLQAKFKWPKKSEIEQIENGYLYTKEEQIFVRYKYQIK